MTHETRKTQLDHWLILPSRFLFLVVLLLFGAVSGCSGGGQVNLGDVQNVGAKLSDYVATWSGHAQAYVFSDGSDHIRLTIDSNGHGTLRVGEASAPPDPTDPHVGYPPDAAPGPAISMFVGIPGFSYPIYSTQVQSHRIQLGVDLNDIYTKWCALQTPGPSPDGNDAPGTKFTCGPQLSASLQKIEHPANSNDCTAYAQDGSTKVANCDWLDMCWLSPVCTCTATACSSTAMADRMLSQYPVQIDGQLDASGETFTGTMAVLGNRVTVILERQD